MGLSTRERWSSLVSAAYYDMPVLHGFFRVTALHSSVFRRPLHVFPFLTHEVLPLHLPTVLFPFIKYHRVEEMFAEYFILFYFRTVQEYFRLARIRVLYFYALYVVHILQLTIVSSVLSFLPIISAHTSINGQSLVALRSHLSHLSIHPISIL
ncbi:hypothetical protein F5J12DRAFT_860341 [Pisolithus orientalis]|uniref:uncharacterized protein n=1 Tax=Pisolithus orientalis TaxID=936130 RepID=UPI0022253A2D|nr:uncharacterized protein F5J12DRAFT_860341 [Pisolithus orientalis]KAI5992296.1 hypothetical protein F5J12DRAFT_860341 [Pisolithus orientalis]